ncbi:hypothetical protein M1L60_44370 [Actinoplanes sp. TRM 88003]|uniref:Uncharacterized protein n=1 Tax=Paractinoplanes aksuensis TaxID=2939490 RepID=A0ABT1E3R4_9ACTN|nr:hypothetical protein [Actinoplanes aksuensis]MCO8277635.1 hypothetical protein [Actinoplanes aksuensis]
MNSDRLSPRFRRIIAGIVTVAALGAIIVRAFILGDQSGWNLALLAVQGLAMMILWILWGTFRQSRDRQGVDMKAKRLYW